MALLGIMHADTRKVGKKVSTPFGKGKRGVSHKEDVESERTTVRSTSPPQEPEKDTVCQSLLTAPSLRPQTGEGIAPPRKAEEASVDLDATFDEMMVEEETIDDVFWRVVSTSARAAEASAVTVKPRLPMTAVHHANRTNEERNAEKALAQKMMRRIATTNERPSQDLPRPRPCEQREDQHCRGFDDRMLDDTLDQVTNEEEHFDDAFWNAIAGGP
jgi:hypothetical protein